ncbi:MAG: helix-turn-helix domain-containing protein [Candidatus Marinimicrobia bacterium]|nr:helix-turn-helix domain-containing protein [Candidatus Neomarinimicrobiota bacterium]
MDKIKNVYHYSSIKDVIINHQDTNKEFREITDIDPLMSSTDQIISALEANSDIEAVSKILKQSSSTFIVSRDSNKYIQIIELDTPEIKPLEHYKKPETLKKIRTKMGYTQKEFGYKLGYDSIRRAHTISEKEQGKVSLSGRDARILRYLSVFGDLD